MENVYTTDALPVVGPALDFTFPTTDAAFFVGDVHGQKVGLERLLTEFGDFATPGKKRHLVFLGDLVDRGPDTLGTLDLALNHAADWAACDTLTHLPGNHELMMGDALDLVNGKVFPEKRFQPARDALWLMNGGDTVLAELGVSEVKDAFDALDDLGLNVGRRVRDWPNHFAMGDALGVHAGLAKKNPMATLDLGQECHLDVDCHWAWERTNFLTWQRGWNGKAVFHGHTAPSKFKKGGPKDEKDVAVYFNRMATNARVCLDGGAANDLGVAGALVQNTHMHLTWARAWH